MNFVIGIAGAPYTQQGASSAWLFTKAAIEQKHTIQHVFFYLDGVFNASPTAQVSSDETPWIEKWQQISSDYNIDLVICVTAASCRGLLKTHIASGFQLGSTTQFIHAVMHADRYIIFGG